MCHSTLGLRIIKKKKKLLQGARVGRCLMIEELLYSLVSGRGGGGTLKLQPLRVLFFDDVAAVLQHLSVACVSGGVYHRMRGRRERARGNAREGKGTRERGGEEGGRRRERERGREKEQERGRRGGRARSSEKEVRRRGWGGGVRGHQMRGAWQSPSWT